MSNFFYIKDKRLPDYSKIELEAKYSIKDIKYFNHPKNLNYLIKDTIGWFAFYLCKNRHLLLKYNRKNKSHVRILFRMFLHDYSNNNVLDETDIKLCHKRLMTLYPENREKLDKWCYRYVSSKHQERLINKNCKRRNS